MNENIELAAKCILAKGVILVPTDTNYALATNPFNEEACAKLYSIKKRDVRKPLTLFIAEPNELYQYIDQTEVDTQLLSNLIKKYWPGPLNLVLPKSSRAPSNLYFDSKTISVVCNSNLALKAIIELVDRPLGLSSANISGTTINSLVNFDLAVSIFQAQIDCAVSPLTESPKTSVSSTIISINKNQIKVIRQGDIFV